MTDWALYVRRRQSQEQQQADHSVSLQGAAPGPDSYALSPCPSEPSSPMPERNPAAELANARKSNAAAAALSAQPAAEHPLTASLSAAELHGSSNGVHQGSSGASSTSAAKAEAQLSEDGDCAQNKASFSAADGDGIGMARQGSLFATRSGTLLSMVTMPAALLQTLSRRRQSLHASADVSTAVPEASE